MEPPVPPKPRKLTRLDPSFSRIDLLMKVGLSRMTDQPCTSTLLYNAQKYGSCVEMTALLKILSIQCGAWLTKETNLELTTE